MDRGSDCGSQNEAGRALSGPGGSGGPLRRSSVFRVAGGSDALGNGGTRNFCGPSRAARRRPDGQAVEALFKAARGYSHHDRAQTAETRLAGSGEAHRVGRSTARARRITRSRSARREPATPCYGGTELLVSARKTAERGWSAGSVPARLDAVGSEQPRNSQRGAAAPLD